MKIAIEEDLLKEAKWATNKLYPSEKINSYYDVIVFALNYNLFMRKNSLEGVGLLTNAEISADLVNFYSKDRDTPFRNIASIHSKATEFILKCIIREAKTQK